MTIVYDGMYRYREIAKTIHKAKGLPGADGAPALGYLALAQSSGNEIVESISTICSYNFVANEFSEHDAIETEIIATNNWLHINCGLYINGVVVANYHNNALVFTSQRSITETIGLNTRTTVFGYGLDLETSVALGYDWKAFLGDISIVILNGGAPVNIPYVAKISRINYGS